MALTRSVKDTIKARADRDPAFRDALRTEAVDGFLAGDPETGKAPLRHDIDATTGFERPGHETGLVGTERRRGGWSRGGRPFVSLSPFPDD